MDADLTSFPGREDAATVKDLMEHLKKNFKPDAGLCFFDEGGAWIELVRVHKDMLGDLMFKRVSSIKEEERSESGGEEPFDQYKHVEDDGVVVY